jgi:hypothetical protein
MIFCTACKYTCPAGSIYCPRCTRSLNCRLCDKGHKNSLSSAILACKTCQSLTLSEGAIGVPLGWVSSLLTLTLAVFAWKALLAHAATVLSLLGRALLGTAAFLLNTQSGCLAMLFREMLAWVVVLWLFGHGLGFLSSKGGSVGTWLRGLPLLLLRRAVVLASLTLRLLLRGVRRFLGLSVGRESLPESKEKKP